MESARVLNGVSLLHCLWCLGLWSANLRGADLWVHPIQKSLRPWGGLSCKSIIVIIYGSTSDGDCFNKNRGHYQGPRQSWWSLKYLKVYRIKFGNVAKWGPVQCFGYFKSVAMGSCTNPYRVNLKLSFSLFYRLLWTAPTLFLVSRALKAKNMSWWLSAVNSNQAEDSSYFTWKRGFLKFAKMQVDNVQCYSLALNSHTAKWRRIFDVSKMIRPGKF